MLTAGVQLAKLSPGEGAFAKLAPEPLMSAPTNVTQLLASWSSGDQAALEALTPLVHEELHRLAARYMAGERPGTSSRRRRSSTRPTCGWSTGRTCAGRTAPTSLPWPRRSCAASSSTWRGRETAPNAAAASFTSRCRRPRTCRRPQGVDLVALDDALKTLEGLNARQSRVVELRFFGGLSLEEAAHVLDVSVGTVRRDWSLAQAWLFRELSGGE